MSFLNSILSSIGNANAAPPLNTQPAAAKPASSGATSDSTRSTAPNPAPPLKRKAEDVSSTGPPAKSARTNTPAVSIPPKPQPPTQQPKPQPATQMPIRPLPKSNPSTTSIKSVSTSTTTARPSPRPPVTTRPSDTTPGAVKPKAKSSYQAILQRAAAAKATVAEQGQIKHKAVAVAPKLSRQQRLAQEEEIQRKAKLEGRVDKASVGGRDQKASGTKISGSSSTDKRNTSPVKAAKPRVDLGYKGTMRPAVPDASTRKPLPTPSNSSRTASWVDRSVPGKPPDTDLRDPEEKVYRYRSETEDEYDDDDESDDNERPATYADIEEEEAEAERQARKEDARELARENAHRTEKMKRREALERMQAARKKG